MHEHTSHTQLIMYNYYPKVSFGIHLNNSVGTLEYASISSSNIGPVVGGLIAGAVVLVIISLMSVLVPIIFCYYSSISKLKAELKKAQEPVYK